MPTNANIHTHINTHTHTPKNLYCLFILPPTLAFEYTKLQCPTNKGDYNFEKHKELCPNFCLNKCRLKFSVSLLKEKTNSKIVYT